MSMRESRRDSSMFGQRNGRPATFQRNIEMQHILSDAELGIERDGRIVAMVRLHVDDVGSSGCCDVLQLLDHRRGDARIERWHAEDGIVRKTG